MRLLQSCPCRKAVRRSRLPWGKEERPTGVHGARATRTQPLCVWRLCRCQQVKHPIDDTETGAWWAPLLLYSVGVRPALALLARRTPRFRRTRSEAWAPAGLGRVQPPTPYTLASYASYVPPPFFRIRIRVRTYNTMAHQIPPHRPKRPLHNTCGTAQDTPAYPRSCRTRRLPSCTAPAQHFQAAGRLPQKPRHCCRPSPIPRPCHRAMTRGRHLPLPHLTPQLLLPPLGSALPPPDPRLLLLPLPPLAAPPTSSPSAVPPTPAPCSTSPVASSCGVKVVSQHTQRCMRQRARTSSFPCLVASIRTAHVATHHRSSVKYTSVPSLVSSLPK